MAMKRPTRNITGLRFSIDTNVIIHGGTEWLLKYYEHGWIYLETPDTVEFELSQAKDPETKELRHKQRQVFPMPFGPAVLDQFRLDYAVLGTSEDELRLRNVHRLIWGEATFNLDHSTNFKSRKSHHRLRDSMIISTSIRYGISALITWEKALLSASPLLSKHYGFTVINPETALSMAETEVARIKHMAQHETGSFWYQALPEWPA